jgi:DNA-binding FrmR family transcriptional regulator
MLHGDAKKNVLARLRRVEGQVAGIQRMVDDEKYCVDVLLQVRAAQAALGKIGQMILASHIECCVAEAFESGTERERHRKIDELVEVFGRYSRMGAK